MCYLHSFGIMKTGRAEQTMVNACLLLVDMMQNGF